MKELAAGQKAIWGRAASTRSLVLLCLGAVACRPDGVPAETSTSQTGSLGSSLGSSSSSPAGGLEITVITYNVNYGAISCMSGACSADVEVRRLIESLEADVLMLQETTQQWESVLRPVLAERFPHVTCHNPTTYIAGGNCTFSKLPIEEDEALPSPVGWFPANRLVVRSEAGPIELLNVHLRPQISEGGSWIAGHFSTGGLRKREIDAYTPSFKEGLPTIVAGDFNEDIGGDALDVLDDIGFTTGFEEIGPKKKTWHYTAYSIPLAMTLDHVAFEREHFEAVAIEVLPGGRSDHQPVKVTLRMKR